MTSNKVLLFGLDNTKDVVQAESLADQLGQEMINARPYVWFSQAWILKHIKDSPEVAYFLISNCNDPVTLDLVARKERRQSVLSALARNRFLGEDTYRSVLQKSSVAGYHRIADARKSALLALEADGEEEPSTEEAFEKFLASKNNFETGASKGSHPVEPLHSYTVKYLAEYAQQVDHAAERFLTAAASKGAHKVVANYLASYYGLDGDSDAAWNNLTLAPEQVVELLTSSDRANVLTWLVNKMAWWDVAPNAPSISAQMVALIIDHVGPQEVNIRSHVGQPIFTKEAVDLLLQTPGWVKLLSLTLISDDQYISLLSEMPSLHVGDTLALLRGSRYRLELLLDALEPTRWLLPQEVTDALSAVSDPLDPLIKKVIAFGGDDALIEYVTGTLRSGKKLLRCPTTEVQEYIARLRKPENMDALYYAVVGNLKNLPLEYVHELIEHLPGCATYVARQPDGTFEGSSSYIYEKLVSTGAPLAMCLEQLDRADDACLQDVCSALSILAKQC